MLKPIMVSGFGRSGTTALMQLLTGSPAVACDRVYPFENRYLTYYAKLGRLASLPSPRPEFHALQLCDFDDHHFGAVPWPANHEPRSTLGPTGDELFLDLWSQLSDRAPQAGFYAEKAPAWLPAWVRPRLPSFTVHLVRDPRDVYLSAVAFLHEKGFERGFGRDATTSDFDHARNLAHALLLYHENDRADRGREDTIRIRYEDLVTEPAAISQRLQGLTGLTFPSSISDENLHRHRTSAGPQASIGRWRKQRLPAGVQPFLESHLAELMADAGYERSSVASAPSLALDPAAPHSADGQWAADGDGLQVKVTGPDAWIELKHGPISARSVREVWACVRSNGGSQCSLYWSRPREGYDEGRAVHVPFHPGEHWQVVRFVVGGQPHWHGSISQLRLDLFNGSTASGTEGRLRWLRLVE